MTFKASVHGKVQKQTEQDDRPQLSLPGRIIHFVRQENTVCCANLCSSDVITALEVPQESLLEIKISKTMLNDHIVSSYCSGLSAFYEQWEADVV